MNFSCIYLGEGRGGALMHVRGVFGKYEDKFNRMRIKYTRQMTFCINEYQLLNSKYDQYGNRTLINELDIGH